MYSSIQVFYLSYVYIYIMLLCLFSSAAASEKMPQSGRIVAPLIYFGTTSISVEPLVVTKRRIEQKIYGIKIDITF